MVRVLKQNFINCWSDIQIIQFKDIRQAVHVQTRFTLNNGQRLWDSDSEEVLFPKAD